MSLRRRCPECGGTTPSSSRFCTRCGTPLEHECSECREPLLAGAAFCGACGAPALPTGPPRPASTPSEHPEERRRATILFADLAGFTAAADGADPELVKAMIERGLHRLAEEITRYGGYIDKFIGDNVMGVFGAPVAHEDDPERAVRAGIAMQRAMEAVNAERPEGMPEFTLRIGINSGEVLAGRIGDAYTVIGGAVNLASRLETACAPGAVTVGEATWRRTHDRIDYRELEPLELRGISQPVPAWEAMAAVPDAGRADAPSSHAPRTPFVGRAAELDRLRGLVARARSSRRAHLATISGPAGIGKTRLLVELATALEDSPGAVVLTGRCPAYGYGAAYWPLREMLREPLGLISPEDASWTSLRDAIRRLLDEAGPGDGPTADLIAGRLATTLGVAEPEQPGDRSLPEGDPGDGERQRLMAAVSLVLEAIAGSGVLVMGFEDVQWADPGTLELIEHLGRSARAPIVVLSLARDEVGARREGPGEQIVLGPLGPTESATLVEALTEGAHPDSDVVAGLADRSGGNPLFAEEMALRMLEEGAVPGSLPETVDAVLAARLDALAREPRRALHHAAVVGERFWRGSLAAFAESEGMDLGTALEQLCALDLIAPLGRSRLEQDEEYEFRHGLIQEVAYARLPKAERARKHAETAGYVERLGGPSMAPVSGRHYAAAIANGRAAGMPSSFIDEAAVAALDSLETAGDYAAAVHSHPEALDHYAAALEFGDADVADRVRISEKLGDAAFRTGDPARARDSWTAALDEVLAEKLRSTETEARLRRKLGASLRRLGDSAAALEQLQKGIDLLKREDPTLELTRLYGDAAELYLSSGESMLAIYAAEKSLQLSEGLGHQASSSRAYGTFGRVFGRMGDNEKARANLERSVAMARDADPAEAVRALLALGSHLEASEIDLGDALAAYEEALVEARRLGDVPSQIELHGGIARLALRRGDVDGVESATAESAALALSQPLPAMRCFSELTGGWLLWCRGEKEATVSLAAAASHGRELGRYDIVFPALMLLGWVAAGEREFEAARANFDAALEVCERTGLISQSIEATAALAICIANGSTDPAAGAEHLARAGSMADRFPSAKAHAACVEARGVLAPDPGEGADLLTEAGAAWEALERPLAAVRSRTAAAARRLETDPERASRELEAVAVTARKLGIEPLAREARELSGAEANRVR